jgi:DNA/RNA-binding domain of Phe-tRNA-synthetase-like protein
VKTLIENSVFERFPKLVRGIVTARGLQISDHNPRIACLLAESAAHRKASGQLLLDAPGIKVWDEAHQAFGSNPKKYPPSIRSLLQRVLNGKLLPYINDAVALFNAISLQFLQPCGGDDLDMIGGDLCLGLASGHECFIPLGGTETEHPEPGEIIYYDTHGKVMCRRWNWRNGSETKITAKTKNLVINVDGLGDVYRQSVEYASNEIAEWLRTECKGSVRCDLLHFENRKITI